MALSLFPGMWELSMPSSDLDQLVNALMRPSQEDGSQITRMPTASVDVEEKNEGDNYHRVERSYGHIERAFKLPQNTDPSKITAKHENGVLTISVQKRKEEPP
eukprot:jgi/Chlat1/7618/Chrsp64S09155